MRHHCRHSRRLPLRHRRAAALYVAFAIVVAVALAAINLYHVLT